MELTFWMFDIPSFSTVLDGKSFFHQSNLSNAAFRVGVTSNQAFNFQEVSHRFSNKRALIFITRPS